MTNNKGIIEETKETLNDAKQTTKEKFENAKDQIKKILVEAGAEDYAATKSSEDKTQGGMSTADINMEKKAEALEKENAKHGIKTFYEIYQEPNEVRLDYALPIASQGNLSIFRGFFEPTTTARIIPTIFLNLKKILK